MPAAPHLSSRHRCHARAVDEAPSDTNHGRLSGLAWIAAVFLLGPASAIAQGQFEFEREPISYSTTPPVDAVTASQARINDGTLQFAHDPRHGYLRAVLEALQIPLSSQVLVYSKTSLQLRKISPRTPRALYFNDDVYVGWVPQGDVLEIAANDPVQGAMFYTLSQEAADPPVFHRDRGQCLTCHATSRTQRVPGLTVRSVFVEPDGQPEFALGSFNVDHSTPFTQRWGGYYVTGTHGAQRHMGNALLRSGRESRPRDTLDREAGANVTDLASRFNVADYLTPHSDLVALMVLEHQTQMHNLLTFANYEARATSHYDGVMNVALERPADHVSDTTRRRLAAAADKLLRYLLFADEFRLTDPVRGTSGFAEEFTQRGPRDSRGRSLRDFDLTTRLFKYPCSYLIYSPSFDRLPDVIRKPIAARLHAILTARDADPAFAHLSPADRTAILEILSETKPGLWDE